MKNQPCNVVFDGTIEPGRDVDEVKKGLASLFKKDVSEISHFFSGDPVVMKKNIDPATAAKYQAALRRAGAICTIVPKTPDLNVLTPREINSSAQFPPQNCPLLSHTPGGIDFNRKDMGIVPISSLTLLSVFSESTPTGIVNRLLLFVKGFSRPFITDVEKIKFWEFPCVVAGTVTETLKNFIRFLCDENTKMAIDAYTNEFLIMNQQIMRIHNVSQYVNFLGRTLAADKGVEREKESEMPPTAAGGHSLMPISSSTGKADRAAEIDSDPETGESGTTDSDAVEQHFKNADQMLIQEDKLKEAIAEFEKCISLKPDHWEAHLKLADIFLENSLKKNSGYGAAEIKEKALFHARNAYEIAGGKQPGAVKSFSKALAVNQKKEEGLGVLEGAHGAISDEKEKQDIESFIDSFRREHHMGRLWQFFDHSGKLIFETIHINLIREKLINGSIPHYAMCCKNRVGERKIIQDLLANNEPAIDILINPVIFHVKYGAGVGAVVTGMMTGLWYTGKFLIHYGRELPGAFSDWIQMGLENIVAFVAAIILLGIPTLFLSLALLALVIVAIAGFTGLIGAIPGAAAGGLIGWIVGIFRAPFIPKVGSRSRSAP